MPISVGAAPAADVVAGGRGDFAEVYPLSVPLIAAPGTQIVHQGMARFCGWSLIEPSGAVAATVELYDGMDTGSQLLAVVNLPVGGAAPSGMSHDGIEVREGMFLSVVAGSVRGVIWARLPVPG
jgi:hypothetical protein